MSQSTRGLSVHRDQDGAMIPADPNNSDWQAYQDWLSAGNTPAPAIPQMPAVPTKVTNRQARIVLIRRGLNGKVDAALRGADQSVTTNAEALASWAVANTFSRDESIIAAMAKLLELSDADVDGLFITAAAIS